MLKILDIGLFKNLLLVHSERGIIFGEDLEKKNICIHHKKPGVETDQIWYHQHSVHWTNIVRAEVKEGQKRERERKKEGRGHRTALQKKFVN